MTLARTHVVIAPWRTIEADCLSIMLLEVGMAPAPYATTQTALCVLAPPRRMPLSQVYPLPDGLTGLPTVILMDTLDARAIALRQVTGAVAVLTWESDSRILTQSIRSVASGEALVPAQRHQAVASDPCSQMTAREREVLDLVALGHRDDEIAGRLGISPHTVRTHLQHAMTKLDVTHRRAAAAIVRTSPIMRSRSGLQTVPRGPG